MASRLRGFRLALIGWGAALTCGLAAIAAAAAAPFELPPLVQPPSGEHHAGKVIWADLVTPDLASAKRFYGALLGWTFQDIQAGDRAYTLALLDGVPVGGLVQRTLRPGERRQPAWLTFLSVPDVGEATRTIVAHGGRVLAPPRTYPARGEQAVCADPQGAVFAVLHAASGDPPDVLAEPGQWIWSALLTRDPDAAAGFYQAVFGYDVFPLPTTDGREHLTLASDDYARASVNSLPTEATRPPHWLNFVRVQSTTEAVARVQVLGGQVLVAPRPDRHGGLLAVVADPTGAPFGLMEWTGTTRQEPAK